MNRGSPSGQPGRPGRALASMRPRFMNRGSGPGRRRAASAPKRFNEAPIHESGKCDGGAGDLPVRLGLQ